MGDLFPLSDYMIRVLAMIGTWVAGLGAFGAVTVSLCLARRSEKLRLDVKAGWQTETDFSGPSEGGITRNYIIFAISNISLRTVTVQSIGWVQRNWLGRVRMIFELQPWDRQLPLTLETGHSDEIRFLWTTALKSQTEGSRFGGPIIVTPIGTETVRARHLRKSFRDGRAADVSVVLERHPHIVASVTKR